MAFRIPLCLVSRFNRYRKIILLCVLFVIFTYEIHLMYTRFTNFNVGNVRNDFKASVARRAQNTFGTKPQLVIVVQVHNREVYFKYLIDSLRKAAEIETVFLIFSHDWYDEKINKLITTVDFCKYQQIYYPYSIQNQSNTLEKGEIGGGKKYLNDTTAQIKHHWWWKANAVFNSLPNYEGLVLFLEEDFYLIEDFIPTLRQMESLAGEVCKNCILLSLAINLYATDFDKAKTMDTDLVKKYNKFSNMGIALNANSWSKIVNCKDSFCKYNDYNWDSSLQNVISSCLSDVDTMVLKFPRVIHIGACGVHITSENCDPSADILKIKKTLKQVKGKLFPKTLKEGGQFHSKVVSKPNGGWENRDQILCNTMVNSTIKNLNYDLFNDYHISETSTMYTKNSVTRK